MRASPSPIDPLRREIAALDRRILEAAAERMRLARRIGEAKSAAGLPVRDFATEKQVIERARRCCREAGTDETLGERIMQQLILGAVRVQEDLKEGCFHGTLKRVLVVGGNGRMGRWLSRFLHVQGHEVRVCDPSGAPPGIEPAPLAAAGAAEVVVIATPLASTRAVLEEVLATRPRGLLFDVASVKTPIVELLREQAADGRRVVSIHPMFGAGVELLSGRNLLVCRCGDARAVREVRELFADTSLSLVELEIEAHDPLVAHVLGLSHALNIVFFQALRRSGQSFGALLEVASTTFLKQARTASEVAHENPRLYHEIQHASVARAALFDGLARAVEELRAATASADPAAFEAIVEAGRGYFGAWVPEELP